MMLPVTEKIRNSFGLTVNVPVTHPATANIVSIKTEELLFTNLSSVKPNKLKFPSHCNKHQLIHIPVFKQYVLLWFYNI